MFYARTTRTPLTPGPKPIQAPTIAGAVDRSIQAGGTVVVTLTATRYDGSIDPVLWTLDDAPATAALNADGNEATFVWETAESDLREAPYTIVVTVTDGVRYGQATFNVLVRAADGALLTATDLSLPVSVVISADDWVYYGATAAEATERKDTETPIIGDVVWKLSATPSYSSATGRIPFSWSDGAGALTSASDVKSALIKNAAGVVGHGPTIPLAASSEEIREALLFIGGLTTNPDATVPTIVELTLTLDGARPIAKTYEFGPRKGAEDRLVSVQYRAAADAVDPELVVDWTNQSAFGSAAIRAILINAGIEGLSLSDPIAVDEYELYEGTLEWSGSQTPELIAHDLPAGAVFVDNGDKTGTLTYRPPLGASAQSINPIVFEAYDGATLIGTYEAGVTVGEKTADPPVIAGTTTWQVVIGQTNTRTISATGEAGIVLDIIDPPDDLTFVASTGVLSWAPTSDDLAGSPYTLNVAATDGAGRQSAATIRAEVVTSASGNLAIGSATIVDSSVSAMTPNLSTLGGVGWAHVSRANLSLGLNRKATGIVITGAQTNAANWSLTTTALAAACTWTGGTPTATATAYQQSIRTSSQNETFTWTIPVGAGAKDVVLYFGANQAAAEITVSISDGGAVPQVTTFDKTLDGNNTWHVSIPIDVTGLDAGSVVTAAIKKTSPAGILAVTAVTVANT